MPAKLTWGQALAWRLKRHYLEPAGDVLVEGVVDRLCGVQAQVASSADLAIAIRRRDGRMGDVAVALADGRLIKTWAMRGSLHLLAPETAGQLLSLMAASRSWERPVWAKYFGMTPARMEVLREAVLEALDGKVLTREELVAAVTARRGLAGAGKALRSGWGTLLKPTAWQGGLVHGPMRGTRVTFMRPEQASSRWTGVPPVDEAAPKAFLAYLGAYGPATADRFGTWLSGGYFGRRGLKAMLAELGDRVVEVDIEGESLWMRAVDVDDLAGTKPAKTVRLLPGFDQWVLGPGTADGRVTPKARRSAVSRTAGWISPVIIVDGVACGTWALDRESVTVEWWPESGRLPKSAIADEIERLESVVGRKLKPALGK